MAEIGIIPLLNAQQMSMSGLMQGAANLPANAQAVTQQMALDLLRQEAQKVEKPENTAKSPLINDEQGGGTSFSDMSGSRREKKSSQEEAEPGPSPDPLVGKLLNVKV